MKNLTKQSDPKGEHSLLLFNFVYYVSSFLLFLWEQRVCSAIEKKQTSEFVRIPQYYCKYKNDDFPKNYTVAPLKRKIHISVSVLKV